MDGNNGSMLEIDFLRQQQEVRVQLDFATAAKALVALITSMSFVCLNGIMFLAVRSKPAFCEMPRYILFSQMLLNDSIHLILTVLLYSFNVTYLALNKIVCSLFVLISSTTFTNAPLILVVMSLERYVAICFPLRHSNIATPRKTSVAIGTVWLLGALNCSIDVLFIFVSDPKVSSTSAICTRELLFVANWQLRLQQGFSGFYFVTVGVIIIFTYVGILVAARSAKAQKAKRTVLLHMVQLCLCLTSFLYNIIERALATFSSTMFAHLRYANFLIVLMIPRILSPLIYGLRDEGVRPLFMTYLRCGANIIMPVRYTNKIKS